MKILFVENRYKTFFWDTIAESLISKGHEVFWVVQNKQFKPKNGIKFVIPYPLGKYLINSKVEYIDRIIEIDRQRRFFGGNREDYFYYYNERIQNILEKVKPDVIFGESTVFHELLVLNIARLKNIPYLFPSSSRYPSNRIAFYLYDTWERFAGSKENLSDTQLEVLLKSIINRERLPEYMYVNKKTSRFKKGVDKLKKIWSRLDGDVFNTPSIWAKLKVDQVYSKKRIYWENNAFKKDLSKRSVGRNILYALQLQPESNIDVQGYPYFDQSMVIKRILMNMEDSDRLLVKPNPKSYYELTSNDLVDFCVKMEKIILLPHKMKMEDVLPNVDLVVTVTGTIGIECILNNMPIISLINSPFSRSKNCKIVEDLDELGDCIKKRTYNLDKITNEEKLKYLNLLNQTSYLGKVGDGFIDPNVMSFENVKNVSLAFEDVLKNI